jgi:hypothetical protein
MTRPREQDYKSYVSYTRALEEYCDRIEGKAITDPSEIRKVFELDDAEMPPPDSGFMKL